jgi:hypothetical protein
VLAAVRAVVGRAVPEAVLALEVEVGELAAARMDRDLDVACTSLRAIFHASDSRSWNRSCTQFAENSVGRNRLSVPVSLQKLPSWIGLIHWLNSWCPRSLRRALADVSPVCGKVEGFLIFHASLNCIASGRSRRPPCGPIRIIEAVPSRKACPLLF